MKSVPNHNIYKDCNIPVKDETSQIVITYVTDSNVSKYETVPTVTLSQTKCLPAISSHQRLKIRSLCIFRSLFSLHTI